jgi:ADP-ribosylglycohydrolase
MTETAKINRRDMLTSILAAAPVLYGVTQSPSAFALPRQAHTAMMKPDYVQRVYAGVLGKIIGVYFGQPFEGWEYRTILEKLGELTYYVNEGMKRPVVVTDDDISGTFSFLRALPDYDYRRDIPPAQIGQTWLNYLIENKTVLWWGGMGNSTEHTAFLRLKAGIEAPRSGSIALNGKIIPEQVGAQIFIDGWAMVAPGDPEFAADLARRAGSVSHDGEALHAAQVLAAMEAQAFVQSDVNALIDTGVRLIPADSTIRRMIADVREWHAAEPDWHKTRQLIEDNYGYGVFPGNTPMVPNHALIIMALLYGNGDFHRSLGIIGTAGWDTDCNCGNLGCLLGIRGGLAGLEGGPDWRGPVNDRILISTADGGRSITDAVRETYAIVNAARALQKEPLLEPKAGARFHFELPGSTQGFKAEPGLTLENVAAHSRVGTRSLALRHSGAGKPLMATTPTFEPTDEAATYALSQSPTLYAGQILRAGVEADASNKTPVTCQLMVHSFGSDDTPVKLPGTKKVLQPGEAATLEWRVPDTKGPPIAGVGVVVTSDAAASVYLDLLGWDGVPDVRLGRGESSGTQWRRAWVNAVDHWHSYSWASFPLAQDHGRGMLIQGTREWADYAVSTDLTPHMVLAAGLAARVQGLRRYYALLLRKDGHVTLIKAFDGEKELARAPFQFEEGKMHQVGLLVDGARIQAFVDKKMLFDLEDTDRPLLSGAVALVCEEGTLSTDAVTVAPLQGA